MQPAPYNHTTNETSSSASFLVPPHSPPEHSDGKSSFTTLSRTLFSKQPLPQQLPCPIPQACMCLATRSQCASECRQIHREVLHRPVWFSIFLFDSRKHRSPSTLALYFQNARCYSAFYSHHWTAHSESLLLCYLVLSSLHIAVSQLVPQEDTAVPATARTVPKACKSLEARTQPEQSWYSPLSVNQPSKAPTSRGKKLCQQDPWLQAEDEELVTKSSVLLGLPIIVISSSWEIRTRKPPAKKAVKEKQMASLCTQIQACSEGMNNLPSLCLPSTLNSFHDTF